MDVATCKTFLAAVMAGSFAGAARRVNASPSTVTERIKQLESRLDTQLFIRTTHGCNPTLAGKRLIKPARQMVKAWELAVSETAIEGDPLSALSIGGQYSLWPEMLMPWFENFQQVHPDMAFGISAGHATSLHHAMNQNRLDSAIMHYSDFSKDVIHEKLVDDRLILVTATPDVDWQENYVRVHWGRKMGLEITAALGRPFGGNLSVNLETMSRILLLKQGKCGYLPESTLSDDLSSGRLTIVPDTPVFDYPIYLCWRSLLAAELVDSLRHSAQRFFNPVSARGTKEAVRV